MPDDKILEMIHEDVKSVKSSVSNIYKIINGNGKIGLVTKVELNTKDIADHAAEQGKRSDTKLFVFITIIAAVIGGGSSWLTIILGN